MYYRFSVRNTYMNKERIEGMDEMDGVEGIGRIERIGESVSSYRI